MIDEKIVNTEMPIIDLLPYANNSRTHSDAQVRQIAASIKEFDFTNPVIIDENGLIIAGHGRVLAAELLNIADVPCRQVFGWSEAKKKAYCIADNQLPLNAGWNTAMLEVEIEELMNMKFDISLLGFDDEFLDDLMNDDESIDDYSEIEEESIPVSKIGDSWIMGSHRLICGMCIDASLVKDLASADSAVKAWQKAAKKKAFLEETGQTFNDLEEERNLGVTR